MQFHEKLKRLRTHKGISQTKLAESIYVSRSAVAKWENGLGLPSEQSLKLLAEFFGVTPAELFSDPTTETVIVAKNKKISYQKVWIVVLIAFGLVAVCAAIVLTVLYAKTGRDGYGVFTRKLIFETERGSETHSLQNYGDDEISVEMEFAESRTFEVSYGTGSVTLPGLLVKTTKNGEVAYESVDYRNIAITYSEEVLARVVEHGVEVLTADYYSSECVGWANIKYGDLLLSIKIERHKLPVQSVEIKTDDGSDVIGVGQKKLLRIGVIPYDAPYRNVEIAVEKIVRPDGTEYLGELSAYAIVEDYYLKVSAAVLAGSRIYVSATVMPNGVKSADLVLEVVRIPAESFSLRLENLANYVKPGESAYLTLIVRPANASFNVLGETANLTLLTPDLAILRRDEHGRYLITVTDNNAVGKSISVRVEVDGIEKVFSWKIVV